MPIIPAFNPATGASGGPAATGGTNAQWIPVTDLSTAPYTSSDPNALVSAYSFAGQEHSIGLVTVNPAVADYAINSGTDFTGPRWYVPLVDSAGVAVRAQDRFVFNLRFRDFDTGSLSRQWGIGVGVAQNSTSTVLSTMGFCGHWFGLTGAGTPNVSAGFGGVGTFATVSLVGGANANGVGLFGGLPGKLRGGNMAAIFSASAADDVVRADGAAWSVADATQLSLMIIATTLGNVTTTAGTLKMKIDYAITRL